MKFPRKVVTESELGLWRRAIAQVVVHGPTQASLDTFKMEGHKQWEWRVQESHGRLFREHGNWIEVYGHIRRGQYKCIHTSCLGRMRGAIATVEEVTPGTMKVCSVASPPICPVPPANFLNVMRGWGQT
jgi:hypothetical protein